MREYIKKGAIHMIIICTTLIREKHAGGFCGKCFSEVDTAAAWFPLLSHIQFTIFNDDDDDWKTLFARKTLDD